MIDVRVDEEKLLTNAVNQFNLVLQLFPRADSKMSTLLGYNLGMLGFLGANAPRFQDWTLLLWVVYPLAVLFVGLSLVFVYKSSYPTIISNKRSLIFFNDIAALNQDDFVAQFRHEFRKDYADDMLRQIWCNSEILHDRFHYLQQGYKMTALAVAPWVCSQIVSAELSRGLKL